MKFVTVLPIPWQLSLFCVPCLFSFFVHPLDKATVQNYVEVYHLALCMWLCWDTMQHSIFRKLVSKLQNVSSNVND